MDIKDLILLMWRNIRYIILGLVIGAGVGFFVSKIQAPVYEATTKIFVSRTRQQSNSDMLSLSDEQLLAINLQLAKSQPIMNDVSLQLGSWIDVNNILVDTIPNSLILQIKVQDTDPQRAATIANLIVHTLVKQNEALLSARYAAFENAINEQVNQVQKQIDDLEIQINGISATGIQEQLTKVNQQIDQLKSEISGLEQEIAMYPSSLSPLDRVTLAEKQAKLNQLHSLMNLYQQIQTNLTFIGKPGQNDLSLEDPRLITLRPTLTLYQQINSTLINNRENVRMARMQSSQNVLQIVSAIPPKNPIRPLPVLYILISGSVGFILVITAILVIDHMDESLKSAGQIEDLFGIPVLGHVVDNQGPKNELVILNDPLSAKTEAFRALGARLEIIGAGKRFRTVMVVNTETADTRTTIAANLAVIYARQGKQVILLDGDLRHPYLHDLFKMKNQIGFAQLLNDSVDAKSACHAVNDIQGLTLIPSGDAEKELTAWLDVKKWEQLLLKLHKLADLVIVDSPPAEVADAQILASKMDEILLVIEAGHTRVDSVQGTLKKFQMINAKVAGAVLCRTTQYLKINKPSSPRFKINVQKMKSRVISTAKLIRQ
jgi:capsular exopolysaccharide synthesis family protein